MSVNQIRPTNVTSLEKTYEGKKSSDENLIVTAQNYFCLLYLFQFFFFLNICLFYITILAFIGYLVFPCKTLHNQWSRFSSGIAAPQLSGTMTVYIS